MKFRVLYIINTDKITKTYDEIIEFEDSIDEQHLQDFYRIFDYNTSKEGLAQLCSMIPINEDGSYGQSIFVTKDFQVFQDLDIRKWLGSIFKDMMPVYNCGVFQRMKKL